MTFPWLELARLVGESIPAFLRQTELLVIVVVVLLLVHMQYKRISDMERRMFGIALGDPVRNTAIGLAYGVLGGLLATFLFVVLGISLVDVGIGYLWVLAIVLMTVHPRFLCFSYAGGLLSASHLLFGWPALNVPAVMGLVAVLHLVESLLIWVHGAKDATPVYVRRQDGRVVGGFALQKFWPMPFIALIAFMFGQAEIGETTLAMPDWWPLIQPRAPVVAGHAYVYMLFPVIAALGYGDIAITRTSRVKARRTAGYLLVYSVVLMGLALAGSGALAGAPDATGAAGAMDAAGRMNAVGAWPVAEWQWLPVAWQWLAALFAIFGHEAVIHLGRRAEERGAPVYDAKLGAVLLDVVPGSPAAEMGLQTGDIIRKINGYPIRSGQDIRAVLTPWAVDVTIDVDRVEDVGNVGANSRRTVRYPGKLPPFGIILAPGPGDPGFMSLEEGSRYGVMLRNIGRRVAGLFGGLFGGR